MEVTSGRDHRATSTRPALFGWLTAVGVSAFGDRMSMLAIPWFVLTTTGSPVETGLVAVAELAPMVLLQVLSGPAIDRLGPGRSAVWCDAASMLVIGSIPALHHLGLLSFPLLLVLVALGGSLRGPSESAKDALIPHMVEHTSVPIERATSLENATFRAAMMLGAAIAGALIALIGPTNTVIVDAVSFGLSAFLLAFSIRRLPRHRAADAPEEQPPYLVQIRAGWRFLRSDRVLFGIAVMLALVQLLDMAFMTVLVPVWADTYAGPAVVGLVFAFWNLFSMLGSLATARWGKRYPRYPLVVLGFLLGGLPRYAVFAFNTPIWLVMVAAAIGGFSLGVAHPTIRAVQLDRVPRKMLGRVMTLSSAMISALVPFSGILGGGLVHGVGLTTTMLALGAVYVVIVLVPSLDPAWRQMGSRPDADTTPKGSS